MDNLQKIANRIALGLVLAALIVGAALMMQVRTRFTLFGYPGLAILLFLLAAACGFVLVAQHLPQRRLAGLAQPQVALSSKRLAAAVPVLGPAGSPPRRALLCVRASRAGTDRPCRQTRPCLRRLARWTARGSGRSARRSRDLRALAPRWSHCSMSFRAQRGIWAGADVTSEVRVMAPRDVPGQRPAKASRSGEGATVRQRRSRPG